MPVGDKEVAGSAMYGRPQYRREQYGQRLMMLPVGRDAFSEALGSQVPAAWNVSGLLDRAREAAIQHDDISLVGLAARAGDPVVLAALRESVVLYAEKRLIIGGDRPKYKYLWRVGEEIARCANRFIDLFNHLIAGPNATLPASVWMSDLFEPAAIWPVPRAAAENAADFYRWYKDNDIMGRCAHVGTRSGTNEQYHWAVRGPASTQDGGGYELHDFWSKEPWTTSRYRREHGDRLRLPSRGSGSGGIEGLELA